MIDLDHNWGGDLAAASTGDLLTVAGSDASQQRILRRLLTSPGSYLWNLSYGAGLGRLVGTTVSDREIKGLVYAQLRLESSVAQSPRPVVGGEYFQNSAGIYNVSVRYQDTSDGTRRSVVIPLGE